jgi:hypothetical protein
LLYAAQLLVKTALQKELTYSSMKPNKLAMLQLRQLLLHTKQLQWLHLCR